MQHEYTEQEKQLVIKFESGAPMQPAELAQLRAMGFEIRSDAELEAEARELSSQVFDLMFAI